MTNKVFFTLFIAGINLIYAQQQDLTKYVNPIIGTEKMGHTFPGATVPFGSVQLSPETDNVPYSINHKYNPKTYDYCSGYRYEDKTIIGFSHTHFNGVGHSDLGDFLIMPTVGQLQLNPGTIEDTKTGYRSHFSHENEQAEAGYYKVKLDDYNILAEMTATTRVGFHQYTFPKSTNSHIIFDLNSTIYNYDDKNTWTYVKVINDTLVTGYRQTRGWARNRTVYFAMTFSKPFKNYGQKNEEQNLDYKGFWRKWNENENFPLIEGKKIKMYFDFDTNQNEKIKIKFAISPVSQKNALQNLQTEIPNWNFEEVRKQAKENWNKELNRIQINASENDKVNFYTAMYHTFINPTTYMDVNGEYKGLDQEVHQANGFVNYTTFSLWDTYRALHPFFNLIQPSRNNDIVKSMLKHYDQNPIKMLPIWSHYANENWCMSGYHSVSVLADAIVKGIYTGDVNQALDACIVTSNKRDYEGIGEYIDKGYIAAENNSTSVSNTLEYAFDDWSIAQIAKKLNKMDVYDEYIKRSENWKNNYDTSIGFMRPKLANGTFKKDFDVLDTHGQGFIEGNSWNYSFFVPQNPNELIKVMGGKKKFASKLDELFNMHLPNQYFENTEDITKEGIIGGYVHGNEPAHHVAYLYNWVNQPWKTQEKIRMILEMQYKPTPDGLGGNDDTGQMSAWYIFSALGFYPVQQGSDSYAIGSPLVDKAVMNLENGKQFIIEVENQSKKNVYIQKIELNGKKYDFYNLKHQDITNGGKIKFFMGSKPNR
ncbi:GH92 family glycosyl hydrolase [Chishuiella sp.]|uniref:GH92 family glycosyl hydrolase n=1 Tax=Chishuiella sp. TaxID=1969467 RepID=UPI0028B126F5|nr:GH92 family glycosyl hydrolase [Chishuiella sp.]